MKDNVIYPRGWLHKEMKRDLQGFVGNLDRIVPDILVNDDIYVKDRLTNRVKTKDVGAIAQDADWEVQYLWWNSESFSNWLDGFVRNAFLLEDAEKMERAKALIYHILDSQDEDGYLGIYDEDLRYSFQSENGELWAQATFFRAALSYYKLSGETIVLEKISKAVNKTMESYKQGVSRPFSLENDYAGACHGLMFVDICYSLYGFTGESRFIDYATWLYDEYSQNELSEQDIRICKLENFDYSFYGHGPHIYEHFRALLLANLGKEGSYESLVQSYLHKLFFATTPSGGPIGDEWVFHRTANATTTGYEYCSLQELLHSYGLLLDLKQDGKIADKMEWLCYNAAFGARHPEKSQIAYCQRDNAYKMYGKEPEGKVGENTRYKYSVAHQDAAVCCVPNAGRILSYFLDYAYREYEQGMKIDFYVPSVLNKVVNGVELKIEQETDYPFRLSSRFLVSASGEVSLLFRKPAWAKGMTVHCSGAMVEDLGAYMRVTKHWKEDEVIVSFEAEVIEHLDFVGDVYYSYGALVYGAKIEECYEAGRNYGVLEADSLYLPKDDSYTNWKVISTTKEQFNFECQGENYQNPSVLSSVIEVNGEQKRVEFYPMGSLILRKVTFERT